jgi:hypothetical protein
MIKKKKNKAILGKPRETMLIFKVYNCEILDTSLTKKIKSKSIKCWRMKLKKKYQVRKFYKEKKT